MANEQDIFIDRRGMKINGEQRDTIMYNIGKIDGIIVAGCSFDGDDIKKLLEPIRKDLSAIIAFEEL